MALDRPWRLISILTMISLLFFVAPTPGYTATPQERIDGAIRLIKKMAEQKDSPRMADLIEDAKGIAIFPSVIKAGLIIGGQRGEGLFLKKDPAKDKWYGPNFVNITGLSYGLQIGAQSIGLVLVVINEDGLRGFMGDNVKLSGDLSVAAGPLGRHTEAGTDSRLEASIYSYSIAKGLFAGLSVEGAVIDVDENANIAYWGANMSPQKILSRPATDARIKPLLREISNLEKKPRQIERTIMSWQEIAERGHYGDKIVRITVPHKSQRIEKAPVVILLHGVHGCANAEPGNKYLHIAQILVSMGINAAMIETSRAQRNPELYGDDRVAWAMGAFSGKTFEEDLADNQVGVNRVKKDFPHSALWLWGFSLGGIHSVLIAGKEGNSLEGLILSGSGIELTKEAEGAVNLPILDTMPQKEELKEAARQASAKKVIAFWGSEDNVFSRESCMALVDLIPIPPEHKEFHIIEGADHSFRLMEGKQSTEPIKTMVRIAEPQILHGHGASKPK